MSNTKTVYQTDTAGHYLGECDADESPLEPGVWHIPARAVLQPPPTSWPEGQWPRWDGQAWQLVTRPTIAAALSPAQRLAAFLQANPDVQSLIG